MRIYHVNDTVKGAVEKMTKKEPKNSPEIRKYWRELQRAYRARKKTQAEG
jgi:hypothetical protein